MDGNKSKVNLTIDITNMDEYLEKANRYIDLLKEAKTLAEDLASTTFEITINQDQE